MATYSPQILAFPEVSNGSGIFIDGQTAASSGEGLYSTLPRLKNQGDNSIIAAIPCAGFDEAYFMPVGDPAGTTTPTFNVFGVYGNKQSGGDSTSWTVHLLLSMTTADISGAPRMDGPTLAYDSKNPTLTAGFSAVLDSVIGCATLARAASSSAIGLIGMPHLGGADYILVTMSSGSNGSNMWVRFG